MAMFKTCQRPTVTDSAVSGAVANFNTILNVPLKSHEVAIVASQSGSGTPSPTNVRPITVYSQAVISQSGVNMLPFENLDFTISGIRFYTDENNTLIIDGTSTGVSSVSPIFKSNLNFKLPAGTYYFKGTNLQNSTITIRRMADDSLITQTYSNITFTISEPTEIYIGIYIAEDKSFNNVSANFILSNTDTTYIPYNGTTNTIPFGQTVAGGVLDVKSGVVTVTHGYIASYNGETINEPWISSIDEYVVGTTPSTGAQVAYELATPTTIQLTPLQLSTLIGDNNIWADTGDTSLEYYDLPIARSGEFREVFKLPTSI